MKPGTFRCGRSLMAAAAAAVLFCAAMQARAIIVEAVYLDSPAPGLSRYMIEAYPVGADPRPNVFGLTLEGSHQVFPSVGPLTALEDHLIWPIWSPEWTSLDTYFPYHSAELIAMFGVEIETCDGSNPAGLVLTAPPAGGSAPIVGVGKTSVGALAPNPDALTKWQLPMAHLVVPEGQQVRVTATVAGSPGTTYEGPFPGARLDLSATLSGGVQSVELGRGPLADGASVDSLVLGNQGFLVGGVVRTGDADQWITPQWREKDSSETPTPNFYDLAINSSASPSQHVTANEGDIIELREYLQTAGDGTATLNRLNASMIASGWSWVVNDPAHPFEVRLEDGTPVGGVSASIFRVTDFHGYFDPVPAGSRLMIRRFLRFDGVRDDNPHETWDHQISLAANWLHRQTYSPIIRQGGRTFRIGSSEDPLPILARSGSWQSQYDLEDEAQPSGQLSAVVGDLFHLMLSLQLTGDEPLIGWDMQLATPGWEWIVADPLYAPRFVVAGSGVPDGLVISDVDDLLEFSFEPLDVGSRLEITISMRYVGQGGVGDALALSDDLFSGTVSILGRSHGQPIPEPGSLALLGLGATLLLPRRR